VRLLPHLPDKETIPPTHKWEELTKYEDLGHGNASITRVCRRCGTYSYYDEFGELFVPNEYTLKIEFPLSCDEMMVRNILKS
jgi:hypothetical protein